MKKELRERVWSKYKKHCAYCGCDLTYKQLRIDHIKAKYRGDTDESLIKLCRKRGSDDESNLNPSCGSCNSSKGCMSIESFRTAIMYKLTAIRRDSSQFRLLERYEIVKAVKDKVVFYFEKERSK